MSTSQRQPWASLRTLVGRVRLGLGSETTFAPPPPTPDPVHRERIAEAAKASTARLGLEPTQHQLAAASALAAGYGVEMDTGEGKTLVGALAAASLALGGRHVHVLTVNDYLARRDAAWMGPIYRDLGLSVAAVGSDSDPSARAEAYRANVVYAAVTEIGYDVLRDGIARDERERVHPILDAAIVDEADAVMIDEAVSPLVLAGERAAEPQDFTREIAAVRRLIEGTHFELDRERSTAFLTDAGATEIERDLGVELYAEGRGDQLSRVNVALMAVAVARRDVDYVVRDGAVRLVNEGRGRIASIQRWPDGLHAAVEAAEGITATQPGTMLDTLTIQDLLARYNSLAGMSGTLVAVANELEEFYGLKVCRVDRATPNARTDEPLAAHLTRAEKVDAMTRDVAACVAVQRPVLVGTQSVSDSEALAAEFAGRGILARVLNARNDEAEAALVAEAGAPGAVTISTQMSGRGTDVRLGGADGVHRDRVVAAGGLRVIADGIYPTKRLDAQLRGRAGRQGDPGSAATYVSLDDDLLVEHAPDSLRRRAAARQGDAGRRAVAEAALAAQRIATAQRLDRHRSAWEYSRAISKQRRAVLATREQWLTGGGSAADAVRQRAPELVARLEARAGRAVALSACRDIALWQLDELWSEHLELLDELRDGIHLRALADEAPTAAFHMQALREFEGFFDAALDRIVEALAGLDADSLLGGVATAVRRPSATWTYMLVDNPLGSRADRATRGLQRLLHR
ncbi:preprotein translocase subunit SecA [Leucobacter komagatae]|uniref:Protein translocase subunit SecA n=1 Tax=Leucobacter komagatae TaxID=55969 RepID=A0A542Y2T3_9MICO|nr:accessory Sec system translocase SecA2 [Leucobacter komagatae]TQL42343.1 preprotein translocase subunit SecA [Leucobacter komagatae]